MEQGQTQTQPLDALAVRGLGGTSALAWGSPSPQSAGGPRSRAGLADSA